jgi:hypothetical protein
MAMYREMGMIYWPEQAKVNLLPAGLGMAHDAVHDDIRG